MKTLAVVQARMGSSRLPGKVMKPLGSKRALGWCTQAALRTPGVDCVVVATSVHEENDVIEGWCHHNGIRCYRGSEDDVLDRYCGLIDYFGPTDIVRLTGDCPLLDHHVIGSVIALHQATDAAYTTNQWPPTWPDGLDCEVVKASALLEAGKEATSLIDRETVTQYIWRNQSRWPVSNLSCPINLVNERWVLDSAEDLDLIKAIFANFSDDWVPNYLDVWHFLNENPHLRLINPQWTRNQRFYESLSEEAPQKHGFQRSKAQLDRALKVIPYASQTYSKSCKYLPKENAPHFASHGDGAYIFDIDGNRYIDCIGAILPVVLGYNDPDVNYAIKQQLDKGISLSLATNLECELAELLCDLIPCAGMARFAKNGSDTTSGALRLARAITGRDRVGIVAGEGYHGWHDWAVAGTDKAAGVPGLVQSLTTRMEPDGEQIEEWLCLHQYAALVIDPEGMSRDFLEICQELCQSTGTLLIFDEIRTGFRYDLGGYQSYIGVHPDLACFGKSIANGMPLAALVGKQEHMERLGEDVFWSGTYFGETLSLAAALATIKKLIKEDVIGILWEMGEEIGDYVDDLISTHETTFSMVMGGLGARKRLSFFSEETRQQFMRSMGDNGVLMLNSVNLCYAMGQNEVDRIKRAFEKTICTIS